MAQISTLIFTTSLLLLFSPALLAHKQETFFKITDLRLTTVGASSGGSRRRGLGTTKAPFLAKTSTKTRRSLQEAEPQLDAVMSTYRKPKQNLTRVQIGVKKKGAFISSYKTYELIINLSDLKERIEGQTNNQTFLEKDQFESSELQLRYLPNLDWSFNLRPIRFGSESLTVEKIAFNYSTTSERVESGNNKGKFQFNRYWVNYLDITFLHKGQTKRLVFEDIGRNKEAKPISFVYTVGFLLLLIFNLGEAFFTLDVITKWMNKPMPSPFVYSIFFLLSWLPLSPGLSAGSNWYHAMVMGIATRYIHLFYILAHGVILLGTEKNRTVTWKERREVLFGKKRWLMWVVSPIYVALTFVVPYLGMQFNLFYTVLICIDIFSFEYTPKDENMGHAGEIVVLFLSSNLQSTLIFYLNYWISYNRKYGGNPFLNDPFVFFKWFVPNVLSLVLIPLTWYWRVSR